MADKAVRQCGTISKESWRGQIVAESEYEPVGAVVRRGTKQTGYDDPRRHSLADGGVGSARQRKVHVVHEETPRGRGRNELWREPRGMPS